MRAPGSPAARRSRSGSGATRRASRLHQPADRRRRQECPRGSRPPAAACCHAGRRALAGPGDRRDRAADQHTLPGAHGRDACRVLGRRHGIDVSPRAPLPRALAVDGAAELATGSEHLVPAAGGQGLAAARRGGARPRRPWSPRWSTTGAAGGGARGRRRRRSCTATGSSTTSAPTTSGRTVLLDWEQPGRGAALSDLAWYLAINCRRLPQSKEATIEAYRDASRDTASTPARGGSASCRCACSARWCCSAGRRRSAGTTTSFWWEARRWRPRRCSDDRGGSYDDAARRGRRRTGVPAARRGACRPGPGPRPASP